MKIKFSPCQAKALPLLEDSSNNIFLTGKAGSGKSFLIRHFLRTRGRKTFPVVASTGAAAVLVGGRTFHSFFGLGIMEGGLKKTIKKALANRRIVNRLKKIEGFVLDEVSMIPASAFCAAEMICRQARGDERPWGGARIIAVGDFAQLPPVNQWKREKEWAFLDESWNRTGFEPVILRTIMRGQDEEYISVLNRIREGIVDDVVENYLNRKVDLEGVDYSRTHLFSRRNPAEKFNRVRLEEIKQPLVEFVTHYTGEDHAVERLRKVAPIPETLQLKVSALVMMRSNDSQWRYVNGSLGTVEDISGEALLIRLHSGKLVEVEKLAFSLLDAEGRAIATAANFPVSLAYATTIHKAQGATLDSLVVNLSGLWDPGQAYVALSRLPSGEGLTLTGWNRESITVDPDVVRFHRDLEGA